MEFCFEEIDRARRILGLGEEAKISEIRSAFHRLARSFHPDSTQQGSPENRDKYKEITWAYTLLLKYCQNYRFSFREEDVKRQTWDEETYRHLKQFYDGWWGEI